MKTEIENDLQFIPLHTQVRTKLENTNLNQKYPAYNIRIPNFGRMRSIFRN